MVKVETHGPYTYVESPVDWFAIDVLAVLTILWVLFTFWHKGVRGNNITRYPQIHMAIPYPQWRRGLLGEKPAIGAGRAISAFFKTLFADVLAMGILKCEYGRSEREVVHTRGPKRVAKFLMVWGFVFAALSTTIAYFTFPHNMIVLDSTHPARVLGMVSGVFLIVGAAIWLSVRYKEVGYSGKQWWQLTGAEYLPVTILLLGVSGFVLQAAVLAYANGWPGADTFLWFAVHFHAIPVAAFFWLFFWTKADHIVYRIFWRIYDYADKELAGANTRLPPTTLKPLNKTGKEIQPGY